MKSKGLGVSHRGVGREDSVCSPPTVDTTRERVESRGAVGLRVGERVEKWGTGVQLTLSP